MNKTEKQTSIDALQSDFSAYNVAFAFDYRGLNVEQVTELRKKIRELGGRYQVVKNTLALRALEGTSFKPLSPHFKGMTSLACTDADPVALARILADFAKDVPALAFKAGVVSGRHLDGDQFKALASLPGREVLLAKLLYTLQAPVQNLLGVLQGTARDLILVLKAAADKKKED